MKSFISFAAAWLLAASSAQALHTLHFTTNASSADVKVRGRAADGGLVEGRGGEEREEGGEGGGGRETGRVEVSGEEEDRGASDFGSRRILYCRLTLCRR